MDPDEQQLARGSKSPSGGPWLVIVLIFMLGFLAFAVFSL